MGEKLGTSGRNGAGLIPLKGPAGKDAAREARLPDGGGEKEERSSAAFLRKASPLGIPDAAAVNESRVELVGSGGGGAFQCGFT